MEVFERCEIKIGKWGQKGYYGDEREFRREETRQHVYAAVVGRMFQRDRTLLFEAAWGGGAVGVA